VGSIRYADGSRGTLLYLKAAVTGDEPGDVLQYQTANKEFPHQTTGDQFFSESQFESYRRLGFHAAMEAFQPVRDAQGMLPNRGHAAAGIDIDLSQLFVMLRQAWRSGKKWTTASFTRHTERLDEIMERLRQDSKLRFLDQQIYLQWKQALPPAPKARGAWWPLADEETFARAFYFCHSLIQLMEDVYLDLDLERNLEDPDVRGWTNLFRHWSGSDMLRLTFAIVACTFGGRFQSFCERHLGLTRGEIRLGKHGEGAYNEYETGLLQVLEAEAAARNAQAGDIPVLLEVKPLFVSDAGPAGRGWTLTVGFAFLEEGRLRWIRIQNHLRKMGLGREALEKLVAENVTLLPYAENDSGKAWWEFNSREHVRWAARILSTRIV
jgi:hypothetical protein